MNDTEESVIAKKLVEWNKFLISQGMSRNERRLEVKRMRKDLENIDKNVRKAKLQENVK